MSKEVPTVAWKEDKVDFFGTAIPVYLPNTISKHEFENMPAFVKWKATLHANLNLQESDQHAFHEHPYSLRSIEVKSVTRFPDDKVGFIKIDAAVERDPLPDGNSSGISKSLPGTAFLRGGSVAMLMILRPKDSRDERYVILTEQPRIPAGSLKFLEIPAGMIDDETKHFRGVAAKEIQEETGFKIPESELIDMTKLALSNSDHQETSLQSAMYPSPGGCDEYIALFLWEKKLDRQEIEDLRGRLTGVRTQNEMITLHVKEYEALWRDGARDAKTLAAWALYEGLNRSGELAKERKRRRESNGSTDSSQDQAKRSKAQKRS